MNSTLSRTEQNYPSLEESFVGPYGYVYVVPPLNPVYLKDGSINLTPVLVPGYELASPVAALDWNVSKANYYRTLGNVFAELSIRNFKIKTDAGWDFMLSQEKIKNDMRLPGTMAYGAGEVSAADRVGGRAIIINTLTYENTFGAHNTVNLIVGQEAQADYTNQTVAVSRNFAAPYFEEVSAGSTIVGGPGGTTGNSTKETQLSFFSKAGYGYKRRYLLDLSFRRDGSSKFGANHRFGNYWSAGAAWIVSDESFLKSNVIHFLKLRGSVGTAGNALALGSNARYFLFDLGSNYSGNIAAQLANAPGNSNIKWEETLTYDVGIEFGLFKRVTGNIDLYKRRSTDLLYIVSLPGTSGYSSGPDNIGTIENKGIELSLSANMIRSGKFNWNFSFNWSANRNRLTSAKREISTALGYLQQSVGENFNSFYLVSWAGVNPETGVPQWYDKDSKITEIYSPDNRVIAGKPQPDGFGSVNNIFSFGRLQLSASFYYQYGFKLYDEVSATLVNDGNVPYSYFNQSIQAIDYWRKPGDVSKNPRRMLYNFDGGNNTSTRYLHEADYIRLRNVVLSYGLTAPWMDRLKIQDVRLMLQGNNLALWTKFPGLDPENAGPEGTVYFSYPQARTFSLGIDIKF